MTREPNDRSGPSAAQHVPASVALDPERRLSAKEVAGLVGVGLTTLSSMVNQGKFPQPERIGRALDQRQRHRRWRRADVVSWLSADLALGEHACADCEVSE